MEYLYYSVLFAFLFVYSGLGLTLAFCPEALKKHALFLSPLVGYCYLTLAGSLCYNLNLKGTDAYAPALLIPPLIVLYYALVHGSRHSIERIKLINGDLVAPVAVGIIAFIIISVPSIVSVDSLTSISLGNVDIASSANTSRYLKEFARSDTVGFFGDKTNEFRYVPHVYFGPCFSTALSSSLFSVETYKLQNISLNTFFLFSVLLFYSFAREAFRYNQTSAILVTSLYGLSPIMYFTTYQGFQSQIIGTGLAICLMLLQVKALENSQKISDYYSYVPLALFFTGGLLLTYRHMLPLICIVLAAYVILTAFSEKSKALIFNWVLFLAVTIAGASVLTPSRLLSLPAYMVAQGSFAVGWHIPMISLDSVFGLTFGNVDLLGHMTVARVTASILLAGLAVAGYVDAHRKDRKLFLLAFSLAAPILLGYVILAFPDRTGSGWGGYRSYKLLSFFLPQVLLSALIVFRNAQFAPKDLTSHILRLSFAVLLISSGVSCYAIVDRMSKTRSVVSKDMADLRKTEDDPRVESINILRSSFWNTVWQAHFLMRKPLYFESTTYYDYTAKGLDGQWDLKSTTRSSNDEIIHVGSFDKVKPGRDANSIAVNSSYVLERAGAVRTLQARFEKGWYSSEGTHIWTGESGDASTIILRCSRDKLAINLRATYWPLDPGNRLVIYLNGSKVTDCPDNSSCRADGMVLSAGQNELLFMTALPPTVPPTADPRRLGYAFRSIELTPSETAARLHNESSPGESPTVRSQR